MYSNNMVKRIVALSRYLLLAVWVLFVPLFPYLGNSNSAGTQQQSSFTPSAEEVMNFYIDKNIPIEAELVGDKLELIATDEYLSSEWDSDYFDRLQNILNTFIKYIDSSEYEIEEMSLAGITYIESEWEQTYIDRRSLDQYYYATNEKERSVLILRLVDNPTMR